MKYEDMISQMGQNISVRNDQLTFEGLKEAADLMSAQRDPYLVAELAIDKQLKKKGLPNLEDILEVFYEARPEYKL